VPNPPSEWVTREDERLRIVPQALWDRVQARIEERVMTIGTKVKAGVTRARAAAGPRVEVRLFQSVEMRHMRRELRDGGA
jgi:hypothetical protein